MYKIKFYEGNNGNRPVKNYLKELGKKNNKASRIKYHKIIQYLDYLKEKGTFAGNPIVKHIEEDIWEFRPDKERIFFVVYHKGVFILLHAFTKKTQKRLKRNLNGRERNIKI